MTGLWRPVCLIGLAAALVLSTIGCGGDEPSVAGAADGGENPDAIAPQPDGGDAASDPDAAVPGEGGPALLRPCFFL